MDEGAWGWVFIILLVVVIWWNHNRQEEKVDNAYDSGYEDGYDEGQRNPLYPEDITRQHVSDDPWEYCGEWLSNLN